MFCPSVLCFVLRDETREKDDFCFFFSKTGVVCFLFVSILCLLCVSILLVRKGQPNIYEEKLFKFVNGTMFLQIY